MRNGGGAFLIPYFTFLFLCGIPLFYLEVVLGQFSSQGTMNVWKKMCPLFSGIGWSMVVVSLLVTIYFNIIIAWVLYFLGQSCRTHVPWGDCNNAWNTDSCVTLTQNFTERNSSFNSINSINSINATFVSSSNNSAPHSTTPAEEFFHFKVLEMTDGIEHLGGLRWELALALLGAGISLFLCICKGIKSSGKVVYVTVTLPYVFLTILLVRGLTLPGSLEGIKFFIIPKWTKLLNMQVWIDACIQVFFSLGPGWGGLLAMSSYNKFRNNCFKDCLITGLSCSGTSFYGGFVIFSVIGYMAHLSNVSVEQVITQGPGLAFIAYPEAISKLPISSFWAICFFLMLFTLGLDSQFVMLEVAINGFVDRFPKYLEKRRILFSAFMTILIFFIGLPLATRGGMYVFQIIDWYSATFSILVICLAECAVVYIYGIGRLYYDMEYMFKSKSSYIWVVLWLVVSPIILLVMFGFSVVQMSAPQYGEYVYPAWANGLGWAIAMTSIIPIPIVAVYKVATAEGTLRQRVTTLLKPEADWGPLLPENRLGYKYNTDRTFIQRFQLHDHNENHNTILLVKK